MTRETYVYTLPRPVEVNGTTFGHDRVEQVAVFASDAGWVAVLLGEHVERSESWGVTGREFRERVTRPVGFVRREGDRMPDGFILDALRAAQGAGIAVSVPADEAGAA